MNNFVLPPEYQITDARFGCGPSKISKSQLEELHKMSYEIMGTSHRQAPVKNLVADIRNNLSSLFNIPAGYEIILGNGGSTAFWDCAAYSLIENKSQHLSFGEFGAKFAKAASAPHLSKPEVIVASAGDVAHPTFNEEIDIYAWPQNETSTGVIRKVKRICESDKALTVIDATSAAGGMLVDISECDVYYFAPQKNFASDGGIWFAIMSPAAIERIYKIAETSRYIPEFLSLKTAIDNSRLNQTLNTPALATLILMNSQLKWMLSQGGLSKMAQITGTNSNILYEWADNHEYIYPFVKNKENRSPVVVTLDFDEKISALEISRILRKNNILDTDSYRKLGRNQIRIATFANSNTEDVHKLSQAIDWIVEKLA